MHVIMNSNAGQKYQHRQSGINIFLKKLNQNKLLALGLFLAIILPYILYIFLKEPQFVINTQIVARQNTLDTSNNERLPVSRILSAKDLKEQFTSSNELRKAIRDADIASLYSYEGKDGKNEVRVPVSPIKITMKYAGKNILQKKLKVQVINNLYYKVDDGEEKPAIYRFGELVDKAYADFEINKRYSFVNERPIIKISFEDVGALSDRYKKDLEVERLDNRADIVTVSLKSIEPEKDQQFIAALLNNFDVENQVNLPVDKQLLERLNDSIASAQNNLKLLSLPKTETRVTEQKNTNTLSTGQKEILNKRIKILDQIIPYLRSSVNQFVIVPDSFVDFDDALKYRIENYNKTQTEKQNLLSKNDDNSPVIINANLKLMEQRNNLLADISVKKNEFTSQIKNAEAPPKKITEKISVMPDKKLVDNQKGLLEDLLAKKQNLTEIKTGRSVKIIEKIHYDKISNNSDKGFLYGSLILAFLIPVLVINKKEIKQDVSTKTPLNTVEAKNLLQQQVKEKETGKNQNDIIKPHVAPTNLPVVEENLKVKPITINSENDIKPELQTEVKPQFNEGLKENIPKKPEKVQIKPSTKPLIKEEALTNESKEKTSVKDFVKEILPIKDLAKPKINVGDINLEDYTSIPLLGSVAHIDEQLTAKQNIQKEDDLRSGFKNIFTELERLNTLKKFKVILISSSSKKEGKTFFSVNMASAIAAAGKKVVLVDFNLVKPNLLKRFNLNYYKGVTSYVLNENLTLRGIILDSKINPNLSIIGAGPLEENPELILRNARAKDLFRELRKKFDYIILDVPSISGGSYLHRILPFADFNIFVARVNTTIKNQINNINDLMETSKLKSTTIVLNDRPV